MGGNGGVQVCVYLFQCPHLSLRHAELNGSNDSTSSSAPDIESLNGILGEGLAVWRLSSEYNLCQGKFSMVFLQLLLGYEVFLTSYRIT